MFIRTNNSATNHLIPFNHLKKIMARTSTINKLNIMVPRICILFTLNNHTNSLLSISVNLSLHHFLDINSFYVYYKLCL